MKQEFKNIAKNYVSEEELERHEEILRLTKELKLLSDRSERATYSNELPPAEREAGLSYLESQTALLKRALSHPQLKTQVHTLLSHLVYTRNEREESPIAERKYDCALRLIQAIGVDPLLLSLKGRRFDPFDRRLTLVDVLFDLSRGKDNAKKAIVDALMQQVRSSKDSGVICRFLQTVYRGNDQVACDHMQQILERAHLPASLHISLWRFTQYRKTDPNWFCMVHFRAVMELEETHPGLCAFLWENFGISFFWRYPKEVLIAQRAEFESLGPYGVVMYAHDDHNGAFNAPYRIQDLYDQIKGELHLRITEVGSLLGAVRALVRLHQQYYQNGKGHKIQFIDIGGHGTPETIQLGDQGQDGDRIQLTDLERAGAERIRTFFEEDATAILESCSTGEEDGLGQRLSSLLGGMRVIAPKIPTGADEISATKDATGKWKFDVTYEKDSIKAVYKKGAPSA